MHNSLLLPMLLFFWLSGSGCSDENILDIDGTVSYIFDRKDNIYWLKRVEFKDKKRQDTYRLLPSVYHAEKIAKFCNSKGVLRITDRFSTSFYNRKNDLFFSEHYKNHSKRGDNPIHYGGDIYYRNNSKNITIAFSVKGQALLYKNVCTAYIEEVSDTSNEIPCKYESDKIQAPLMVLLNFSQTSSLMEEEFKKMNLEKSEIDSFTLMWCE